MSSVIAKPYPKSKERQQATCSSKPSYHACPVIYLGKTVSNYLNGVCTWHIVHSIPWSLNDIEIEAMLKAAMLLTPTSTKCDKWDPYTIDLIITNCKKLNLEEPLDVAVFACLTTIFYVTARVGEFIIPRLNAFDPNTHIPPTS
ncbi:uncharacterized protein HD556DRAFT_1444056 [Suillus plorans]|uniref:Uncharacterized protein n=1 Tax=Suillus plorans TaxID=116603 RepID=A0A9P7APY8_9AGAM|nr:uncharacterized protein HD556DRAFT_1444056 [Suillus plorans]KAG1792974.1 hypothetical protein HD556DRAFT_1444056 [Suillus plorans]